MNGPNRNIFNNSVIAIDCTHMQRQTVPHLVGSHVYNANQATAMPITPIKATQQCYIDINISLCSRHNVRSRDVVCATSRDVLTSHTLQQNSQRLSLGHMHLESRLGLKGLVNIPGYKYKKYPITVQCHNEINQQKHN